MNRRSSLIILALLAFSGGVLAQGATTFDVTPKAVTLLKGGKMKLKVADGFAAPFTVAPSDSTKATIDPSTLEVSAKDVGEVEFTITASGQSAKVQVRVVEIASMQVEGIERQLIEGERRRIAVVALNKDGSAIPDVPFEFKVEPASVARVEPGPDIVATATGVKKTPVPATVSVSLGGSPVVVGTQPFTFAIKVAEPIAKIEVDNNFISVVEGVLRDLGPIMRLIGKNGSVYKAGERPLRLQADHLDLKSDQFLLARELPTIGKELVDHATLESPESTSVPLPSAQLSVTISFKPNSLEVVPTLIPLARNGTSQTITASLFDRAGNASRFYDVSWSVSSDHANLIAIEKLSNKTARLLWKQDPAPGTTLPRIIDLTATATLTSDSSAGGPTTATAFIRILPSVTNFAQLRVRLNIMDDRTVADLFGEKTAKEFYVARVRLNNNLKKSDDGEDLRGESILAFSDSIEVAVGIEKREPQKQQWWQGVKKSPDPWSPMTRGEVELMASTGAQWIDLSPFSKLSSKTPKTVLTISPDAAAPSCHGVLTYRPYSFEMIVNSSDPRYERSRRAKAFRMLNGIGTLASFITSVAVPGPQSDIPLGIEKFTNLLIPGLQKLYPDIRDTQRQNIVSMTMQPIEEIPFGSDLSRVLFFPKGSFQGMLRGHETRISEICTHLFTIEVAVLDKSGKQTITTDASQ